MKTDELNNSILFNESIDMYKSSCLSMILQWIYNQSITTRSSTNWFFLQMLIWLSISLFCCQESRSACFHSFACFKLIIADHYQDNTYFDISFFFHISFLTYFFLYIFFLFIFFLYIFFLYIFFLYIFFCIFSCKLVYSLFNTFLYDFLLLLLSIHLIHT